MRVALTAGFDRAPNVLALAELLRRDGHVIAGILVVTPYRLRRLRSLVRQRGKAVVVESVRRLVGLRPRGSRADPIDIFLRRHDIAFRSIRKWCGAHGVSYLTVFDLNAPAAIAWLGAAAPDVVVYGGGGILGTPFLEAAGRRVLNAHSGRMPEIRGMNACEWSLLLGVPLTVTIHYIDEGIDTGAMVERISLLEEPGDTIERLRGKCIVAGIEGLRRAVGSLQTGTAERAVGADSHRQCYVMAPVIRELLQARMRRKASKGRGEL